MSEENRDKMRTAIAQVQDTKNPDAFRYIYEVLSPRLYYMCLRYLNDDAEAKDALQESFVTVYEKINKYKGKGSFEGWVRQITVNNCLQRLKKRKKTEGLSNIEVLQHTEQIEIESGKDQMEIKTKLKAALQQLPDGFRTIINLYILEDYSHGEIAKMLHIKESTSRSQLNRAKLALKKIMTRES